MKWSLLPSLLAAALLASPFSLHAADAKAQLQELVEKVKAKLKEGKRTEQALTPELATFDALLEEHKGEKTDDVAQILFMKAALYAEAFHDETKAAALLKQVETDFPGTKAAQSAARASSTMAAKAGLKPGAAFPDFEEKDLEGKSLSIAALKGKVVLIDFWATWCGPCVGELPNVLKTYASHHDQGFEIIGISLDRDREALTSFVSQKKMPWAQYFDGLGWQNKLAAKYGINSIPATFLLDRDGKIIAKDLRGEALEEAVARALK